MTRSTDIPRVLFYFALLFIPTLVSTIAYLTPFVLEASNVSAIQYNDASFDYQLSFMYFRYKMVSTLDPVNNVYPTDWQTLTFDQTCQTIQFGTDTSPGEIIDTNFFCSKTVWQTSSFLYLIGLCFAWVSVVLYGVMFVMWKNHPLKLKYAIITFALFHLLFQSISIWTIFYVVTASIIQWPHHVSFSYGYLLSAGILILEFFFLILYAIFEKQIFLEYSSSLENLKPV
ncbi:hypothetical protein HDV04_004190 [Boothiomyces sp. JEL0838]|nr:hypothetical protein HDV04_004190 [Boothiomyces sp. JEL0838]